MRAVTWNCDPRHKKNAHLLLLLPGKTWKERSTSAALFGFICLPEVYLKDGPMFSEITKAMFDGQGSRPQITSYDSGYEHSFEHYAEVCQLVEEAHGELMTAALEEEEKRITALAS